MRHHTMKINSNSALFAFESHHDADSKTAPQINRFYREKHCYSPMDAGRVIGHGLLPKCVSIIKASSGDLIAITERLAGESRLHWSYYRIGSNLEIMPHSHGHSKLSHSQINKILRNDSEYSEPLIVDGDDIISLFSQSQPSWLQRILNAQLTHWHLHDPIRYYTHLSQPPNSVEFQRCVALAPYQALAKWKLHLDPAQLNQAIRASSEGAVRYAIADIPPSLREDYLGRNPSSALHHAARLSDAELALCCEEDPRTALRLRSEFAPKRRAIALAKSYLFFWNERNDCRLEDFQAEVMESIRSFPLEWVAAHGGDFGLIVEGLHTHLCLLMDTTALLELFNSVEPSGKAAVANYIASRI